MRNECRSRMKNSRNSRNSRNSWNFKNFKKFQEFVNLAKFPRISSLLILSYKGLDFVKFIFSRRFHIFRPLKRILIMKKARPGSSNLVPIYIYNSTNSKYTVFKVFKIILAFNFQGFADWVQGGVVESSSNARVYYSPAWERGFKSLKDILFGISFTFYWFI